MTSLQKMRKALGLTIISVLVISAFIVVLGIWGVVDGDVVGKALLTTFFLMFSSFGIYVAIRIFGSK
ncbi:MAG: hypothetical protein Q9M91_03950 [Candidatus Dojkabacteria bacterium]|nr:hypothetical protein [Candidatus Dojkabacteria bacterium]MDQ7020966.1 hypothetical protein [Candidatus Dojkabacteria bacterium]